MNTGNRHSDGRGWVLRSWMIAACAVVLLPLTAEAQQPKPRATVGAYYFDGWSGQTNHITDRASPSVVAAWSLRIVSAVLAGDTRMK